MFEQGLPERFREPKGWLWSQFTGARGQPLRYGTLRTQKTPAAHIVYIEGLSEYAEKTFELARDFNRMAVNFSVFDRHGQGKSPRYLPNYQKQHSDGVEPDIEDIITFCREHIPEDEPIVLLGHSTGGLLALLALEKAPDLFKGAILIAPFLGMAHKAGQGLESAVAGTPLPASVRESYVPGASDWLPRANPASHFKDENFSGDPVRGKVHDYWQEQDAELRTGGPTVGWLQEMCKAIVKVRDPAFLQKIKTPVLVFTDGEDCMVAMDPIFAMTGELPDSEAYHYADGHHELLMEIQRIRGDILSRSSAFLKKILKP